MSGKVGETKEKILALLEHKYSPGELSQLLGISLQAVHRHLSDLLSEGKIERFGVAPTVYYVTVDSALREFVFHDSQGGLLFGSDAFDAWSKNNLKRLSYEEKQRLYTERVAALDEKREDGLFDLTGKLQQVSATGESQHLDSLHALSLRALEDFGRTRLGVFLDVVKTNGSVSGRVQKDVLECAQKIVATVLPALVQHLQNIESEAIAFVPHTRKRSVSIMDLLQKEWGKKATVPVVALQRVFSGIPKEQKHIRTIAERIENADKTFRVVATPVRCTRLLLVDDFAGSGATLNQIAKEIKHRGIAQEVFGFVFVGEEKGYKVVRAT